MSDETENDGATSQDEAEGAVAGADLNLDEIEEAEEIQNQNKGPEFEIGEPMAGDVTAIYDIPVRVSAVLGSSTMQVSQLLKLGRGAVVELDRKVGEAIDIYVNNRLVARGEVVVVEDKLGITMTEIVKSERS
ncbi:MAG: flagellar motor switch protein FliN [Alphaproteobacteria bacterium]